MILNHNLIATRKENQLTQKQVANLLNITLRHYQSLEAGTSDGSIKVWKQLSNLFNKSLDYLVFQIKKG